MGVKGWRWIAAGLGVALIIIISLANTGSLPGALLGKVPYIDKVLHFLLIGSAAYVLHRALERRKVALLGLLVPLGPLIIAGVTFIEECAQMASPHRSFSFGDMAANLLGVVTFTALDLWMERRGTKTERAVTREL